ncbi:hypothetical protein AOLI_G00317620 [Acnodon oligacanthus]
MELTWGSSTLPASAVAGFGQQVKPENTVREETAAPPAPQLCPLGPSTFRLIKTAIKASPCEVGLSGHRSLALLMSPAMADSEDPL